jgi:2-keto-4-pentenoate hydratase
MTMEVWEHPAIARGIRRQRTSMSARLGAGETIVGWKVGLGAPITREQLGLSGPVVGFLASGGLLPSGATVHVGGWTKPGFEPELAVHLRADVEPGATQREASAAIGAVGLAIEIVDVDVPTSDLETVVAGDIYQRHVILGPADPGRKGGDVTGLRIIVTRDREGTEVPDEVGVTDDPTALTGDPAAIVAYVASWLGAAGDRLCAGQLLICGSTLPLVWVAVGDRLHYRCDPLGDLTVSFAP